MKNLSILTLIFGFLVSGCSIQHKQSYTSDVLDLNNLSRNKTSIDVQRNNIDWIEIQGKPSTNGYLIVDILEDEKTLTIFKEPIPVGLDLINYNIDNNSEKIKTITAAPLKFELDTIYKMVENGKTFNDISQFIDNSKAKEATSFLLKENLFNIDKKTLINKSQKHFVYKIDYKTYLHEKNNKLLQRIYISYNQDNFLSYSKDRPFSYNNSNYSLVFSYDFSLIPEGMCAYQIVPSQYNQKPIKFTICNKATT